MGLLIRIVVLLPIALAIGICQQAVDYIQRGPISEAATGWFIGLGDWIPGFHYIDLRFRRRKTQYSFANTPLEVIWNSFFDTFTNQKSWRRLSDAYPGTQLWVDRDYELGWWQELTQSHLGNCYLISGLILTSTQPRLIKTAFVQQQANKAGIYTIRLYVRGKPTYLTIDDEVLFKKDIVQFDGSTDTTYAEINLDYPSLWGILLEKAWSKLQVNYVNSEGGYTSQVLKALLGCPVMTYSFSSLQMGYTGAELHKALKDLNEFNTNLFNLGTAGFGLDDTKVNECGVTIGHAFPILAYIELQDVTGTSIEHRLYMVRDPRGKYAHTRYNLTWNSSDTDSWTDSYRSQVPYGIDPLDSDYSEKYGLFFVDSEDIFLCFSSLDQAFYQNDLGYQNYWYEVNDDPIEGQNRSFAFDISEQKGRILVSVETYYKNMIPNPDCYDEITEYKQPKVDLQFYLNDQLVNVRSVKPAHMPYYYILYDDSSSIGYTYDAGDQVKIMVQWDWLGQKAHRDYSVIVYAQ